MKFPTIQKTCLFWTFVLGTLAASAGPVRAAKELRWKFQPGAKLKVTVVQHANQESMVQGNAIKAATEVNVDMTWSVENVGSDGSAKIAMVYDRMKFKTNPLGFGDIVYDSASQQEPEGLAKAIADMVKPMIGGRLTVTMSTRGEILDVQLPEQGVQAVAAAPMLGATLTKDGMKNMLSQAACVFPAEAIDKGASWTSTAKAKNPLGEMTTETTYTYQGETQRGDKTLDEIKADLTVSFSQEGALAAVTVKEQSNSGLLYFDSEAGYFTETSMQQKMTVEAALAGNTITQTMESSLKMKFQPVGKSELTGERR